MDKEMAKKITKATHDKLSKLELNIVLLRIEQECIVGRNYLDINLKYPELVVEQLIRVKDFKVIKMTDHFEENQYEITWED